MWFGVFTFDPLHTVVDPNLPVSWKVHLYARRSVTFPDVIIWRENDMSSSAQRWFASTSYVKKEFGGAAGSGVWYSSGASLHVALENWIQRMALG